MTEWNQVDPGRWTMWKSCPGGIDFLEEELLRSLERVWVESQLEGRCRVGWLIAGDSGIELRSSPGVTVESAGERPRGSIGSYRAQPDEGISSELWPEAGDLEAGWRDGFSLVLNRRGLLVVRRDALASETHRRVSIWSPDTGGWVTLTLP